MPTISINNILRGNGFFEHQSLDSRRSSEGLLPDRGRRPWIAKAGVRLRWPGCAGKDLDAFLSLDLPGTKLIVGDGPDLVRLKLAYPDAVFFGKQTGETLARSFAGSDVFMFPSLTDAFGFVLLEAKAAGLPVAAFHVPGPLDVIANTGAEVLSQDLKQAAIEALAIGRLNPESYLSSYNWEACVDIFENTLAPIGPRIAVSGNLAGVATA